MPPTYVADNFGLSNILGNGFPMTPNNGFPLTEIPILQVTCSVCPFTKPPVPSSGSTQKQRSSSLTVSFKNSLLSE